jgi:hypothetical protein
VINTDQRSWRFYEDIALRSPPCIDRGWAPFHRWHSALKMTGLLGVVQQREGGWLLLVNGPGPR